MPVQLVSGREGSAWTRVGLDDAGRARVVWAGPYDGAGAGTPFSHIEAASLRIGAREPGAVQQVLTPRLGQLGDLGPLLKVDPRGDAIVVWQNLTRDGSTEKIVAARSRPGRPFAPPQTMGTSYPGGGFDAAIAPNGAVIVSWDSLTRPSNAVIAPAPSSPFGPARAVAPAQEYSAAPAVTIDAHKHAIVAWWDLGPTDRSKTTTGTPLLYATAP
jgi:hypothetical protein